MSYLLVSQVFTGTFDGDPPQRQEKKPHPHSKFASITPK